MKQIHMCALLLLFVANSLADFVEDPGTGDDMDPEIYPYTTDASDDGEQTDKQDGTLQKINHFMSDLLPEDMLTVDLRPGEEQTFYMYVDQPKSKIKMFFSVQPDWSVS